MGPTTDLDLSTNSIASLTSCDGVAAFFTSLGYRTDVRKPLSAEAIGLAGDAAAPIREIELPLPGRDPLRNQAGLFSRLWFPDTDSSSGWQPSAQPLRSFPIP